MDPTAEGGGMGDLLEALEEPLPQVGEASEASLAEDEPAASAVEADQAS